MNESTAIPAKSLHRFYFDIWALSPGDAWECFYDVIRDGTDAVGEFGVHRVDAAAPWELDDLRRQLREVTAERDVLAARLAAVEHDMADLMHVDPWPDDSDAFDAFEADNCPPHGVARVELDGII